MKYVTLGKLNTKDLACNLHVLLSKNKVTFSKKKKEKPEQRPGLILVTY